MHSTFRLALAAFVAGLSAAVASVGHRLHEAIFGYMASQGLILGVLMTPTGARIADPVLSTVAQGYRNSDMIAPALFPAVNVQLRGGSIVTFGKESFMLYSNSQRAPGENTKRVQFGYAGSPYALLDYGLEGQVPIEVLQEGRNGPGIDHAELAISSVQDIMALRLEKQSADLARTPGNYPAGNKVTKSGTGQWSDFTGTSAPIADVETAKEAIRAATGKRPNVMVMGALVATKLRQHPVIVDRMKYTGRDIATNELLASLFGVEEVLVGESIYSNDAGTAFTDVWGKDVVLAYTNRAPVAQRGAPSYGYTYTLEGYPLAEEPYYDRNAKSWLYPVTRCEAPVIAAPAAGYLITNAVA